MTAGHRWPARAGGWLAIGTGPGALVFGAEIAQRHSGPAPVLTLLAGGAVMAGLLIAQGLLGLVPPLGENGTLSELAPRYLRRNSHLALNALLALAMVGWFGFNVGLGGAAFAALLGVPGPVGPLLLAAPVVAASFGGMRRWNRLAVATTCSALLLVGIVAARLAAPVPPLSLGIGEPGLAVADMAAFVGFVAVFSLRAPDFSVGLASRRDLGWCVGLLVVPAILIMLAGVGLHLGTGSADLVGTLAAPGGMSVANLLVAIAVIAPAFTTMHSGSLALRAVIRLSPRAAMLAIAAPGLVLAAARFDRYLLVWLTILAALLPALVVPMAVEGARRRRRLNRRPRLVPLWTFAPASAAALVLTVAGRPVASLAGLAIAAALTVAWVAATSA